MQMYLWSKYKGRYLAVPGRALGVDVTVADGRINPDQRLYAKSIVIEGMSTGDIRKPYTLLDPGMDFSSPGDYEEALDTSRFLFRQYSINWSFSQA